MRSIYSHQENKRERIEALCVVSFEIARDKLEKQNIVLAVREISEKKIVRASPHFFNTESEMLQVIDAIKKL